VCIFQPFLYIAAFIIQKKLNAIAKKLLKVKNSSSNPNEIAPMANYPSLKSNLRILGVIRIPVLPHFLSKLFLGRFRSQ